MTAGLEVRQLGKAGPQLSVVGLGCNNFGMKLDEKQSARVVHAALDAGITHFDTAEVYGRGKSEEFLGAALNGRRDAAVIATKFRPRSEDEPYEAGAARRRIRAGCEISLRRLRTDRIDVYYEHHPDKDAPVDEVIGALLELVAEGKVRSIAASNYGVDRMAAAWQVATDQGQPGPAGTQLHWNLLNRAVESDAVPAAQADGIGIVPYFPLASGLLTGKYAAGQSFPDGSRLATLPNFAKVASAENFELVRRLSDFAAQRGHSLLELAIGWLLSQPDVTSVITGATDPAQVQANVAASVWRLTSDDLAAVPQSGEAG
jgi:aryl-alcohol dehydrogenase-like predicted oxidoreductase